ncbi:LssY C-terminal domain-containing protein [Paludibaculum fermentans]|uniref:LssY C-terminal domain-containing protein n=1 Tax=Paludibaculum fermentans TaxID=1473598 RepID=A0A7S7NT17_PALFE|nr:LssY C-terminal domain-containing protein [Paludibaculum fermentans]QOY89220.1 LssY C-terminal domain-containing protein [Paludibaculum fermentans]
MRCFLSLWICAIALPVLGLAADPAVKQITVDGKQAWVDTGIDVQSGDMVKIEAEGSLKYADAAQSSNPEGLARGWKDLIRVLPVNDAGRGALIGRIGSDDSARPFFIGARRESRMPVPGRLFVGLNSGSSTAEGEYKVTIQVTSRAKDTETEFKGVLPPVTDADLAKIPRRVVDKDGNEGDRVNFLVLGTEEQVKQALQSVGWVTVDRSVKDTLLRGALGTLSKQAYLTMPMSELMVFGRAQDYGFAMSDPIKTVMARHHFRIWKAPFEVGGLTLFVGAGTHDIGF